MKYQHLTRKLMQWHRQNNLGDFSWKMIKNPYEVWLREIILQQTRVEQGLPYYHRFIAKYHTLAALAAAKDDDVFRLWQGLGYYNRCRNMLHTARFIQEKCHGHFPENYHDILSLKGIGKYTAAAIASFSFNLPYPVVDGNVIRVLSRLFASNKNAKTSIGRIWYDKKAAELLNSEAPGAYNQAIMDLGATICLPASPQCDLCPLQMHCLAYLRNQVQLFPVKIKKKPLRHRYFYFMLPEKRDDIYIEKRDGKDIWHSLYTPVMLESEKDSFPEAWLLPNHHTPKPLFTAVQLLSHQKIHGYFYTSSHRGHFKPDKKNRIKVSKNQLAQYAFPRLVISFFEKNDYL